MLWVGWGTRTTWELFVGLKLILWPSQTGLDISWASMKNICFLSAQTQLEIVETQSWTAVTGLWAFLPATPPPSPPPLDMKSRSCFVFVFFFFFQKCLYGMLSITHPNIWTNVNICFAETEVVVWTVQGHFFFILKFPPSCLQHLFIQHQ